MASVVYRIVEHDGGWAYTAGGTFSETFSSHDTALKAAKRAALEQMRPGDDVGITWEDEKGAWRQEVSDGDDRPITSVED